MPLIATECLPHQVISSIRTQLPLWKPNSALVAVDFILRHGLVDLEAEPGALELQALLRSEERREAAAVSF